MDMEQIRSKLDSYYADNRLTEGYQFLLSQLESAIDQKKDMIILGILNEILGYLRVTGQYEEGNTIAVKAAQVSDTLGLSDTITGGTTYLNIATFYSISGQYELAEGFYNKAVAIYERDLPGNSFQLASLYNNISIFYRQTGEYTRAYEFQQKALEIITTLPGSEIETATSYSNLAEICYSMRQYGKGLAFAEKSKAIFEQHNEKDPHYSAALAACANGFYHKKDFARSLSLYEKTLTMIADVYGKSDSYLVVKKNKEQVEEAFSRYKKQGMYLSKGYYEEIGKPVLQECFPELFPRMAIGLVGMGSECFGFDDADSRDHDFGPGFCIWLSDADFSEYGDKVQNAYNHLPGEFRGVKRNPSPRANQRVGVFSINHFYASLIGAVPRSNLSWFGLSQTLLAAVTNGEVFYDGAGTFTEIRSHLSEYYPEDVRIKKLAASIAKMAQSGQYNYARCMKRGEFVAASLALSEFMNAAISCVYLLNKAYMPFYKWSHRGMKTLPLLTSIASYLEQLALLPNQQSKWKQDRAALVSPINMEDEKVFYIEKICAEILKELKRQQLTLLDADFLDLHTQALMDLIKDPELAKRHIMEDY